jgi:branched-subunit amino acid transport protein AzlD
MKTTGEAVVYTFVIAAVIVFCRAFPFLFFRAKKGENSLKRMEKEKAFISFVEKTVPPAAMTVLAFNSITVPFRENYREGLVVLTASILTALVHLLRRNTLLSIFGGTAAYFALEKFLMR